MLRDIIDFLRVILAKLRRRPVALCDVGDVDGVASAAIFLRRHPQGVIVLRAPAQLQRGKWYRLFTWDFVADLPCPPRSRVRMRADHHKTNPPCAERECYDPSAPCAALLAAKLLELEQDDVVRDLVSVAIETDTANITSEKARLLDLAIRYARYRDKLYIARKLAQEGVEKTLQDERVRKCIEKGLEAEKLIEEIAARLPVEEVLTVYFPRRLDISFRQLNIRLQKRGSKFVNILVRLGFRTYRLYCGADREGPYDCTVIAKSLGGGGHKFAAGAQYKAPLLKPEVGLQQFVSVLKSYLGKDKLRVFIVDKQLQLQEVYV